MGTFVKIKNQKSTSHKAIIRKKDHKPITRTFPIKGEAKYWASEQESLILKKRYRDPRLASALSLEIAIKKYAEHQNSLLAGK